MAFFVPLLLILEELVLAHERHSSSGLCAATPREIKALFENEASVFRQGDVLYGSDDFRP